jgi:hypothetical protein
VSGITATLLDDIMHGLTANFRCSFELSFGEIAGGKAPRLVNDVGEHIGSVDGQSSPRFRDGVFTQSIPENGSGLFEGFLICIGDPGSLFVIYHYGLYTLGAHNSAHATSAGMSGWCSIGAGNRYRSC